MKTKTTTTTRQARLSGSLQIVRSSSDRPGESSDKSDILISIHPEHMERIVKQTKDHEFRKYLIPKSVERMWFYTTHPESTLKYIAVISPGKKPGEVENENGFGNADFNAGLKESKYGYEIKGLYELREPLPINELKSRYSVSAPQRYTYVVKRMLDNIVLDEQIRLF